MTYKSILSLVALVATVALAVPAVAKQHAGGTSSGKKMMMNNKMENCQTMNRQKHQMMAEMKEQDTELSRKIAKMNNAPDDKKADLMASIITDMAEQRVTRNEKMAKMQEKMMKHMMDHMQMGKDSMSQCPMMMSKKDTGDQPNSDHTKHQ